MIPEPEKRKPFIDQRHGDYYLEGPKSRRFEFLFILDVLWEFLKGIRALHFVGPCITVFGSEHLLFLFIGKGLSFCIDISFLFKVGDL